EEAGRCAQQSSEADEAEGSAEDPAEYLAALRAQSHPDADFPNLPGNDVGHDTVDAGGDQEETERAEHGHQQNTEAGLGVGLLREGFVDDERVALDDAAVDGAHLAADGLGDDVRVDRRANQDAGEAERGAGGNEDLRHDGLFQAAVANVLDDADDL